MKAFYGISLAIAIALCFADYAEGVNCWICYQARSNRDCVIRGFAKKCNPNEGCENEVRYSGHRISITKRCKQLQACSTDQFQNSRLSNKRYQCGADRQNSVCRCCCNSDDCNKNQLSCLDQGNPRCPFLFLPNGSTRCFGSADGISLRTHCRFSCRAGYEIKGATSASCVRSGSLAIWSEQLPRCRKAPTCARLYSHSISNGFVRCSGTRGIPTLGTSCVYRCNPRYFMVNANKRKTITNYERTVCTLEKQIAKWSTKPPNCIEEMCPVVSNFDHGSVTCSDFNKLGSVCEFNCFGGYDLDGPDTIACVQKSGVKEWNERPPICLAKPCPIETFKRPLLDVDCTNFHLFGSVCSVKCKNGYYMSDPSTNTAMRTYTPTCVLSGEGVDWSKAPPKCTPKTCNRVRLPRNAVVKCTASTQYLSRCTFACSSLVHEISGEKSVVCSDDGDSGNRYGVWSSSLPTCEYKKCPPIDAKATDVRCNAGYVYKSTCTFACKDGYFMLAADGVTITKSKTATRTTCSLIDRQVTWSRAPPRCEERRCHELVHSDNGEMACSDTNKIGSKCSFTCFDGFEMAGKSTLQCKKGNKNRILGKWSAPPPICKRRSCAEIYYDKVPSALSCSDEYKYESSCTLRCNSGYYMRESPAADVIDRLKTSCLYSDGGMTWSSRTLACQPKTCEPLNEIVNGTMRCSEELIYTASCEFSCARGFDLAGSPSIVCADDGIVSQKGRWSSLTPTCEPRKCPSLNIAAIYMRADCTKGREYTSKCSLSCQPKYFIREPETGEALQSMEITCDLDEHEQAVWGPKPLTCQPVSCPAIDVPTLYISCTNGNKTDSKCTFSCPIGYDLIGNVTNKCTTIVAYDARWKYPLPYCKVRTCPTLVTGDDVNGTCSLNSDYQSVCSYTCDHEKGLFMTEAKGDKIIKTGISILRCKIDAAARMFWTGIMPRCNIKFCLVRRTPKGGRIKCTNGYQYKSKCTFTCNRGYRRTGPRVITCEGGKPKSHMGAWSNNKPTICRR